MHDFPNTAASTQTELIKGVLFDSGLLFDCLMCYVLIEPLI